MLGVRLGEHHEFHVSRIPLKIREGLNQVVNFIFGKRQPQARVGFHQGIAATSENWHPSQEPRLFMAEQQLCAAHLMKYFLGHAVMQQRCDFLALFQAKLAPRTNVIGRAPLNPMYLPKATVSGDVRCLAGPGRERAGARHNQEKHAVRLFHRHTRAIGQEPVQNSLLRVREVCLQVNKVHELSINMLDFRHDILNSGMQFAGAEWRERGSAAKFKHDINLYRAKRGSLGAI